MKKKLLVFGLAVVMTISYIPTAAFALESTPANDAAGNVPESSAPEAAAGDMDGIVWEDGSQAPLPGAEEAEVPAGQNAADNAAEVPALKGEGTEVGGDGSGDPAPSEETEDTHFKVYPYTSSTAKLLTPGGNHFFGITNSSKMLPYRGKDCVKSRTARSLIDYQLMYYRENAWFKGKGECWGYAEHIRNYMGGGGKAKYYNYKYTKANKKKIKSILKKVRAGTHVRVAMKKNGGGWAHSMALFKFTEKEVLWAENNSGGTYNRVHYYYGTANDFINRCAGWNYFVFVHQPSGYKKQAKLKKIYAYADPTKGSVEVIWPAIKGVKKYTVYRSYKKSSGYKKIATTKYAGYSDKTATPGKKAYYKVKAKTKSKAASATRKIKTPMVTETFLKNGQTKIAWKKSAGAVRYNIYTATFSDSKGDYKPKKLVAKVTGTSWIPSITCKEGDYVIRAISSESGGSSKYFYFYLEHGPEQVQLNATDNGTYVTLSFNAKTSHSDKYVLYRATEKNGTYSAYKTFSDNSGSINVTKGTAEDSPHYFYKVRGKMSYYNDYTGKFKTIWSAYSNVVEVW